MNVMHVMIIPAFVVAVVFCCFRFVGRYVGLLLGGWWLLLRPDDDNNNKSNNKLMHYVAAVFAETSVLRALALPFIRC